MMAALKFQEINKMSKEEKGKKLDELRFELVKSKANASKPARAREIKKIIARIITSNK